ncbi:homeodomain-like superfamily protein [Tanacetum coccineum]
MVSLNPPTTGGGFYSSSSDNSGMPVVIPNVGPTTTIDDGSKKTRKPYTISKSRESWTDPEHDKFLEALQLFDRDWKKIEAFIGSKTVIQRFVSHDQMYFIKGSKKCANELLPPSTKRKAAHPYPQKAAKNVPVVSQVTSSFQTSNAQNEPGYILGTNSSKLVKNSGAAASQIHNPYVVKDDTVSAGQPTTNNSCSSNETVLKTQPSSETNEQRSHGLQLRVLPDFAQVYGFIGSVFDPYTSGHLQKLKKMDPIDVETVLLLMRNLSINLTSPAFEDHRRLLSTYEVEPEKETSDDVIDALLDCQPEQVQLGKQLMAPAMVCAADLFELLYVYTETV